MQRLFASLTQTAQLLQLFQPDVEIGQPFPQIGGHLGHPCLDIADLSQAMSEDDVVEVVGFFVDFALVLIFLQVVGGGLVDFLEFSSGFQPVGAGSLLQLEGSTGFFTLFVDKFYILLSDDEVEIMLVQSWLQRVPVFFDLIVYADGLFVGRWNFPSQSQTFQAELFAVVGYFK